MNLGYTGKPYDPATGLYNYGFRDYQPVAARFTTTDPVRDGNNWFAYVNNDPVNWVDGDGLIPSAVVGAAIGFVTSSVTEIAGRVSTGQGILEATKNTFTDPKSFFIIVTSTALGALTSGASALAIKTTTAGIKATAVIGANTMAKEAVAAVVINTGSGAIDAGLKHVTTNAIKGEPQSLTATAGEMAKGAAYALAAGALTQGAIALGTNVSTYTYNGLERSVPHPPQWNEWAGVFGESVVPAIVDTYGTISNQSKKGK
jgi:RHS repeat-associated protein